MTGRLYALAIAGDGTLTVTYRPTGALLVDANADVRFDLAEPSTSPRNRRTLAHLRTLVGNTLPTWRIRDAVDQARLERRLAA